MKKVWRVWLALILAGAANASLAQADLHTPLAGSSERRALMDAIRPHAEREFRAPIVFVVDTLRVGGGYAFAAVHLQRPGGRPIIAMLAGGRGPAYADAILERKGSGWTVIHYRSDASDVDWCGLKGRVPAGVLGSYC